VHQSFNPLNMEGQVDGATGIHAAEFTGSGQQRADLEQPVSAAVCDQVAR